MIGFIVRFVRMISFIVKKFIGSKNEREVRRVRPLVAQINVLEAELQKLPDDDLRQKTVAWKEELSKIEDREELALRLLARADARGLEHRRHAFEGGIAMGEDAARRRRGIRLQQAMRRHVVEFEEAMRRVLIGA